MTQLVAYDAERYYFQYAPPLLGHERQSNVKPPKQPFTGAEPWQCSVYYLWFLFLQESDEYVATCQAGGRGPCEPVYADFGDIRGRDFREWWSVRGCELFCEPRSTGVRLVEPHDTATNLRYLRSNEIGLILPRHGDVDRAIAEIRGLLSRLSEEKSPGSHESQALYQVYTEPKLSSLYKQYRALRLSRQTPQLSLHQIGELSGAYGSPNDKTSGWKTASSAAASRAIKQAKNIVRYVGNGVFPVVTSQHAFSADEFLQGMIKRSGERREIVNGLRRAWV